MDVLGGASLLCIHCLWYSRITSCVENFGNSLYLLIKNMFQLLHLAVFTKHYVMVTSVVYIKVQAVSKFELDHSGS